MDNLKFMVEIKICGIKREKDLKTIIDLNVTWAGFVFYHKSVRCINQNDQITKFREYKDIIKKNYTLIYHFLKKIKGKN